MLLHRISDAAAFQQRHNKALYWSSPKVLIAAQGEDRLIFPTIIGDSDVQAGQKGWLCYARFDDKVKSERQFMAREFTFRKEE